MLVCMTKHSSVASCTAFASASIRVALSGVVLSMFLAACASSDDAQELPASAKGAPGSGNPSQGTDAGTRGSANPSDSGANGDAGAQAQVDAGTGAADAGAPVPSDLAAALLAKVAVCTKQVSNGKYQLDDSSASPEIVPVCGLTGAVFWKADLDVDCDGKPSTQCNKSTDAAYQPQTAANDSSGKPLDAVALPYVVVPQPGKRFDYKKSGLKLGSVVAVIYGGKIEFGIIGDTGPVDIIGEASYAMAKNLGINPNPSSGGVGSGVTYIAFTGVSASVKKNEDHAEAVSVGRARAAEVIRAN
jgi:Fungal chitosanase of glycosyl hydrolase group 75